MLRAAIRDACTPGTLRPGPIPACGTARVQRLRQSSASVMASRTPPDRRRPARHVRLLARRRDVSQTVPPQGHRGGQVRDDLAWVVHCPQCSPPQRQATRLALAHARRSRGVDHCRVADVRIHPSLRPAARGDVDAVVNPAEKRCLTGVHGMCSVCTTGGRPLSIAPRADPVRDVA
jgi:hypothetical protein